MCSLLGLGGGVPALGFSRMIRATATQVNMVVAKVARNGDSSLSVGVTRLPSDLHYLRAGYLDPTIVLWQPIERYTLSNNANGPTSHFIANINNYGSDTLYLSGPGNPGNAIASLGVTAIDGSGVGHLAYSVLYLWMKGSTHSILHPAW